MPKPKVARRATQPRDIETIRVLLRSGEGARTLQSVGDRWSFLLRGPGWAYSRRALTARKVAAPVAG